MEHFVSVIREKFSGLSNMAVYANSHERVMLSFSADTSAHIHLTPADASKLADMLRECVAEIEETPIQTHEGPQ